jgi:hypothetical protein
VSAKIRGLSSLHQSLNNTETILEKAAIIGQKLFDSGGFFMSVDGPIEGPEQQVSGVLLARFVTSTPVRCLVTFAVHSDH